jgi:methyl-accepting chemotaxis protein
MPKLDHDTLELLLIAVTAVCILFQTILLSATFVAVRKGIKSLTENVDDLRSSAMPVINHTRGFVERIAPKVEQTATNVAEMSQTLKERTATVSASATEIAQRVNAQSTRVDAMVSSALDALDNAAGFVAETVSKPVRQLSGLLASVKAVVEVLGASQPPQRHSPPSQAASHPVDEPDTQSESVI